MKGALTKNQLEYVLFHLEHHVYLPAALKKAFRFPEGELPSEKPSKSVLFMCSPEALDTKHIIWHEGIPILFPVAPNTNLFISDDSGNLIFLHDLLKSAFYLLSGYQEFENQDSKDNLGRFSVLDSIQHKLEVLDKPLVNYYFMWIIQGLEEFGHRNGMELKRRKPFSEFGFLLTHDIDVVDSYTLNYVLYKIKEIVGLRASRLSRIGNIKLFFSALLKVLGFMKKDNPYWNFGFLRELERKLALKSVFFFLDQGVKNHDAAYAFEEERMRSLFAYLIREGCEIGLHGTVKSINDKEVMTRSYKRLVKSANTAILGARQHRLLWVHPLTATIQEEIGFQYDATLGFAAQEGFRNSYCFPFRLYDFSKDRMIRVWEFPLHVMDVTLFGYRNYRFNQAAEKCEGIIEQVRKFNGLFTLLWHNSFFDEKIYPGITTFYSELLGKIVAHNPESILGMDLVRRMQTLSEEEQ